MIMLHRLIHFIIPAILACLAFTATPPAHAASSPTRVWMDVDTANGIGEIDDGLALIQAFHSPSLHVVGVSAVFGNAPLKRTYPIALNITHVFGPAGVNVYRGAADPQDLGTPNHATRAIAQALRRAPLTILALGPVTDIATVLQRHRSLAPRIQRIIVVAGRKPGQKFISSPQQPRPFRDFNFEKDPQAMRVLLDSNVPLVFAPWQVASHIWITRRDFARLQASGGSGLFITATSQQWIDAWTNDLHAPGGNPFDTLAVGYLTNPNLYTATPVTADIEYGPDDQPGNQNQTKPYLLVHPGKSNHPMTYLSAVAPRFKALLLQRLAGPKGLPPVSDHAQPRRSVHE